MVDMLGLDASTVYYSTNLYMGIYGFPTQYFKCSSFFSIFIELACRKHCSMQAVTQEFLLILYIYIVPKNAVDTAQNKNNILRLLIV